METNTNLEKMQKIVIMETLIKFKMIETWVNIIETLICIHIIQKIKKIIPEKVEKENKEQNEEIEEGIEEEEKGESLLGKIKNYDYKGLLGSNEEKESMFEPYEILEHKYYEKMQQLVVKLKEEQSQLQYQLGSTQDAYEFKLNINLEATQSKIPITRESLLSLKDIFTKTKRFMKGDKKTWKENVTEFINKHFMNDLVDDIVTKSHYNSSNVMSIIKDQIPQLRFLKEINMKENFFSTIVEQEGNQYDDKTKTKFTEYYHHFFLENLNGNVKTTEGLKELENLLKEFQKLRDPEFYAKEVLEKIDMTYEPNLNLMRDFVKGNMKTKFEAYVEPNIKIKKGVVELNTERVVELIKEVSVKLEEQQVKVENKGKEIDEKLEALQRENEQYIAEIKAMKEEKNIASKNDENLRSELEKKSEENEAQIVELQKQKEKNSEQMFELIEKEEQNTKLKNDLEMLNIKHEENINKIKNDNTVDKEKAIKELKDEHEKKLTIIETKLNAIIITNQSLNETIKSKDTQIVKLQESIKNLKGLTEEQKEKLEKLEKQHKENVENLGAEYEAKVAELKQNYDTRLKTEEERNNETLKEAADRLEEDYKKELNELQNNYTTNLKELKNQIENLNSDNKKLSDMIKQKEKEINSLNEIKEELETLNNDNEEEINKLTSKITKLEHINKKRKNQIIEGIKEYVKQLEYAKQLSEIQLNKENHLMSILENVFQPHIKRLTNENNELKAKLKTTDEEKDKTQATNKELQEKINSLEQQKNELESQLTLTQNKLKAKQDELNASKAKLQATQEEKDRLQKEKDRLQKEKAELEENIKELETENDALKQANAQNQEQKETQQKEIANQEQIISELRTQLQLKNEEIERNMESIRLSNIQFPKLQKHITELEEKIAELTSEKKEKKAELDAIRRKEEEEKNAIVKIQSIMRMTKAKQTAQKLNKQRQKQRQKEKETQNITKYDSLDSIKLFIDNITEFAIGNYVDLIFTLDIQDENNFINKQNKESLIAKINIINNIIKSDKPITLSEFNNDDKDSSIDLASFLYDLTNLEDIIWNEGIGKKLKSILEKINKNKNININTDTLKSAIIEIQKLFKNMISNIKKYVVLYIYIHEKINIKYENKDSGKNPVIKKPIYNIDDSSENIIIDFSSDVPTAKNKSNEIIELNEENIIKIIKLNKDQYLYDEKIKYSKKQQPSITFSYESNKVNEYLDNIIKNYAKENYCREPQKKNERKNKINHQSYFIQSDTYDYITRSKDSKKCDANKAINNILKQYNETFFYNRGNSDFLKFQNERILESQSNPVLQKLPNNNTDLLESKSEPVIQPQKNTTPPPKTGGKKKTRKKGRTKKKTKTRKK